MKDRLRMTLAICGGQRAAVTDPETPYAFQSEWSLHKFMQVFIQQS